MKHSDLKKTIKYLQKKKKILFLTTSNRWGGDREKPKSTRVAEALANVVGAEKVIILDVSKLRIYHCEGNISRVKGNNCGVLKALLKDKTKNPSGNHRCWASINNPDDELWKVSKALFHSNVVVFFGSVRWGQMNAYYQKLIERLSWIENRHSTLGEKNSIQNIDAGIILIGQNWNGSEVLKTQKKVLSFFGFNLVEDLCWNWQFTNNSNEESEDSYRRANNKFEKKIILPIEKIIKK